MNLDIKDNDEVIDILERNDYTMSEADCLRGIKILNERVDIIHIRSQ